MPAIQLSTFELVQKLKRLFSLQKLSVVGEKEVVLEFNELSDVRVLEGRKVMVAGDYGKVMSVVELCDGVYEVCLQGLKYKYTGEINIIDGMFSTMVILKEGDGE